MKTIQSIFFLKCMYGKVKSCNLNASILQTEQEFKLGAKRLLHVYFLSCGPGILDVWYLEAVYCIFSMENTLSN
jgi:hypothetical protein